MLYEVITHLLGYDHERDADARLMEGIETADWMRAHSQFVFEGATALPLTGRIRNNFV